MPPYRPASQPLTMTCAFFIKMFMFSCNKKYWQGRISVSLALLRPPQCHIWKQSEKRQYLQSISCFWISRIERIGSKYLSTFPLSTSSLMRPVHGNARNPWKYYKNLHPTCSIGFLDVYKYPLTCLMLHKFFSDTPYNCRIPNHIKIPTNNLK